MAGRPSAKKLLDIWMNGEMVGQWRIAANGTNEFAYASSWLSYEGNRPLSLSLPLAAGTKFVSSHAVDAYFENLLPDSPEIRKRVASRYGAASTSAFNLLEKIGRDCVGAIQVLPAGSPQPDVKHPTYEIWSHHDVAKHLDAVVSTQPGAWMDDGDDLRLSIAGAQEKSALLKVNGHWCKPTGATPTTHILKLPMGRVGNAQADFSTSVENEWLCNKIMRAYGLPVPECEINQFEQHKVLVVERFDRMWVDGQWIARLPQEDFCQVFGVPPHIKYENQGGPGIDMILDKLRGSNHSGDRLAFLEANLLFWIMAAPDGHAKNFSLHLLQDGYFRLTPFYDVMSAWPITGDGPNEYQWKKLKLAMAIRSKNAHYEMYKVLRRHWNAVAKRNAVGADFEDSIERIISATPDVIDSVSTQLPANFPAHVSDRIFEGMKKHVEMLKAQPQW